MTSAVVFGVRPGNESFVFARGLGREYIASPASQRRMGSTETSQLKRHAASGVRWNALGTSVNAVLGFVRTAILARFLGPELFGQMAIVAALLGFGKAVGAFGIVSSVIRTEKFERGELAALFWFQLSLTVLVFAAVAGVAAIWASFQPESDLPALLVLAASVMFITVLGTVHSALAQRDLRFRFHALLGVGSNLVGTTTAVVCAAFLEQGVWSFVWGSIAAAVANTACLLLFGGYARQVLAVRPAFKRLAGHIRFGLHVTGSQLLGNLSSHADKLIIGATLGTAALGYYTIAMGLTSTPLRRINPVITRVALPIFAKLDKDVGKIIAGYLRIQGLLLQISAPLLLGVAALAPVLVPLYLGEGWDSIVPLVQVFALLGISRSLGNAGGPVVMALGRTKALLVFKFVSVAATILTVYLSSLSGDLLVMAWALTLLHPLLVIGQYRYVLTPLLGSFWRDYLKALRPGLLAGGAMYLILMVLDPALAQMGVAVHLFAGIAIGAVCYTGVILLVDRDRVSENLRLLLGRRSSSDSN